MTSFFSILWWIMLLLYIPAAVALITIVLLQKGKGAGFAGAFGMGSGSDTVFGPRLARTLPQKLTYASAALFMLLALSMSMISGKTSRGVAPELVDESNVSQQQIDQLLEENIDGAVSIPGAETTVTDMPLVVTEPETAAPDAAAPTTDALPPAEVEAPAPETGEPVAGIDIVVDETAEEAVPADTAAPEEAAIPADESAPAAEAAPAEATPVEEAAPAEAEAPAEEPAAQ
jgi:protein translocase SecG subunit